MVTFSERVDNLKTYLDVIGDSFDGMTNFVVHDPLWRGIALKRPEIGRGDFGGGCWTKNLWVGQGNSVEHHILQSRDHSSSTEVVSF
ncbi:hypothetical protein LIER_22718 [Lithospermum erythrorhizon]|uniref:Uncharacterized protein n=1 Tax=Lithospermum erythrorhizon TaxID=34254 RepID=A0AAV3QV25_LITER